VTKKGERRKEAIQYGYGPGKCGARIVRRGEKARAACGEVRSGEGCAEVEKSRFQAKGKKEHEYLPLKASTEKRGGRRKSLLPTDLLRNRGRWLRSSSKKTRTILGGEHYRFGKRGQKKTFF